MSPRAVAEYDFDVMRRIVVVGTTGSGKTTLAAAIAARLGIPHIELDALHWEANWTEAPTDVLRDRITRALSGAAWVVDGNYGKVRDLFWSRADTVVWLDYSLPVILWQLAGRTLKRVVTREELWSGNPRAPGDSPVSPRFHHALGFASVSEVP
jgi:adenylate kinase family enzyme